MITKLEKDMVKADKTLVADAWESGKLGRDEAYVVTAEVADEQALDDALGLKLISIRLPVKLIEELKYVAAHHGIGYQPLVRDLLSRFAMSELKLILKDKLEEIEQEEKKQKESPKQYELPSQEQRHKRAA